MRALLLGLVTFASGCGLFAAPPRTEACGPGTCSGCCRGATCVQGDQHQACGTSGAACADCAASSQVCSAGACAPPACTTNCPCTGASCPPDYRDTGQLCARNGDCSNGTCLPVGAKNVCTLGCTSSGACVPGWNCSPYPGVSGDLCQCTPAAEVCNGKDDDCNGQVDDAYDADRDCKTRGPGYACVSGRCACVAPYVDCAGSCVDPSVAPWTACGNACVDPRTDQNNCGGCGRVCATSLPNSTAQCLAGVCRVRTEVGRAGTNGLALSGGTVYWTTYADNVTGLGKLYACPSTGCLASGSTLLQGGIAAPGGVAVAGGKVFWADATPVDQCVLPGCQGATFLAGPGWGVDVAVNADTLFFSTVERAANTGAVRSCPLTGCGAGPAAIASQLPGAGKLGLDATHVYWTSGNTVRRCPIGGGCGSAPALVATSQSSTIYDFAVDGADVFFPDFAAGGLVACPVTGCTGPPRVIGPIPSYTGAGVAVDGTNVYWCSGSNVMSCAKAGCTAPLLVGDRGLNDDCMRVLLDDTFVYWVTMNGSLFRVNK